MVLKSLNEEVISRPRRLLLWILWYFDGVEEYIRKRYQPSAKVYYSMLGELIPTRLKISVKKKMGLRIAVNEDGIMI